MQAGDHLISPRQGYTHHGLYIGNDEVIHYAGYSSGEDTGRIVKTSLEHFTDGNPCQVVIHPIRIYDHQESVYRARSRLGEAHYNALLNNCRITSYNVCYTKLLRPLTENSCLTINYKPDVFIRFGYI